MGTTLVVAAACHSSGDAQPSTGLSTRQAVAITAVPTAAPTPVHAASPAAAPTASPGVSASPAPRTGPLLVYTKEVRMIMAGGRGWPTLEVATYDVGAKRQLASFEVGKVGEYVLDVIVVGNKAAANLQERIILYDLDGSNPRELRRAPAGGSIVGVGASRDGTMLALAEYTDPLCNPQCRPYADITSVVFLDVASGRELLVVPQSTPGFAGFRGQAAVITWRGDGRGVVVEGYTYSEAPGGTATVLLDGTVLTHDLGDYPVPAPEPLRDWWYGDRGVKILCNGAVVPPPYTSYMYCPGGGINQPVDLYVADTKVDSGMDIRILGYIQEPS